MVLLLASMASLATAQQPRVYQEGGKWVQEVSGSLAAVKNLKIAVEACSVQLTGGSQAGIGYVVRNRAYTSSEESARRQFGSYKVSAYVRGDTAFITGDWQEGRPHKSAGDVVINLPRDMASVKIETDGGTVEARGIAGSLFAQTGGGSIKVDDIGGAVSAETGGDWINVGTVGGDVNLQTGGGKIYIQSAKGRITASTGGGDVVIASCLQGASLEAGGGNIQVKSCAGKVRVSTGGGNVDLGEIAGPVEIETGGGSIRLGSAKGAVRAETGAGRIELNNVSSARAETGAGGILAKFTGVSGERNDSALETAAGDITVFLVSDLALTIRASVDLANGHSINSEFPDIHISSEGGNWGPRTITAEGRLNGGGPVLKVRTTTGDINFRRASR